MLCKMSSDIWIGVWIDHTFDMSFAWYFGIYFSLVFGIFLFGVTRSIAWGSFTSNVSYNNFKQLMENIIKKPMKFFDTTSVGQILNLTGGDAEIVDTILYEFAIYLSTMALIVFGTFLLSILANFFLTPVIFIMIVCFFFASNIYLKLGQELRRQELQCYSPIISRIVEVYEGIDQFRTYNQLDWQENIYGDNVNDLVRAQIHNRFAACFFNMYIEFLAHVFIILSVIVIMAGILFQMASSTTSITMVAVTVSWIFNIPNIIFMFAFCYCEFVQYMSSFERTVFSIDSEISERPSLEFTKRPAQAEWPTEGKIEIKNIKCRYRDGQPLVLDGVTFTVNPKEKVAIVGRTGAGKSSLMLVLSRILEIENNPNFPPIAKAQKIDTREEEHETTNQSITLADYGIDDQSVKEVSIEGDTNSINLLAEENSEKYICLYLF